MRTPIWLAAVCALVVSANASADEWPSYGRDAGNTRYSPLTQITSGNVAQLQPAWTFHTGDISDGRHGSRRSGFETTPLVLDGRIYLTTPFNRVIALDAATGRKLWAYDPQVDQKLPYGDGLINRGLASWRDPAPAGHPCPVRLFEATLDARLVAVDAATGAECSDFGTHGVVDLRGVRNYIPGLYHMTSPPVVLDGVVVIGSAIDDNFKAEMPDGVVRGYDVHTGELLWSWEPLERPAGIAPERWKSGAANAWSILSADPQRHLIYVPTGSASPDYYGGLRPGDNRWADSVVALSPKTGKRVWGFQLVHHDLWDYDTAAAPLLTPMNLHGRRTPALVAGNKTGMLFVLDPATGKPLLPIEERPVPQSSVAGEMTSPTQPFPVTVPTLAPQSLSPEEAWGLNEPDRRACQEVLKSMSGTAMFSPPSLEGIAAIPGNVGGINWSGFAWDARHERLIVAVTNLPMEVKLIPIDRFAAGERGGFRLDDTGSQAGTPYAMVRGALKAPSGMLCAPPPWGELVAVDLAGGKIVWRRPLGTVEEVFPGIGSQAAGSLVLGGPIVTAGGLIFVGGTMDRRFRALAADSGQELWSAALPASAHALPITYEVDGRQFVVIAAGGAAKFDEEVQGDAVVAFALPEASASERTQPHAGQRARPR
jgi:quinoprotein glucose dehydrogenase